MIAPTEEKLTSSTLQSLTLPTTHPRGWEREKEEEQLTTFLGNVN
jgi:hypothetical protein